jgi:hypothetical protein
MRYAITIFGSRETAARAGQPAEEQGLPTTT